eukprot:12258913-Prorocentrum_lima.AAC.1
MTSSLVGSEMCIRDSPRSESKNRVDGTWVVKWKKVKKEVSGKQQWVRICLLYTSDAADDM